MRSIVLWFTLIILMGSGCNQVQKFENDIEVLEMNAKFGSEWNTKKDLGELSLILKDLIVKYPKEDVLYFQYINLLCQLNETEKAKVFFENIILSQFGRDPECLVGLAMLNYKLGFKDIADLLLLEANGKYDVKSKIKQIRENNLVSVSVTKLFLNGKQSAIDFLDSLIHKSDDNQYFKIWKEDFELGLIDREFFINGICPKFNRDGELHWNN